MLASLSPERFVALDVHKHYVVAGAVNVEQHVVLSPRRVDVDDFLSWSRQHLRPTDAVVLEATTNAWHFCDQLRPLVASVTVAHPLLVKLITTARVKTDARDTLHLAKLLAAGLIPAVWIPPQDVRELRTLVAHRTRLIRQRTQAKNRLRSTLHRYNIVPSEGGLFAPAQRTWWETLSLSTAEKLRIRQDLRLLDTLEPLIEEVDTELTHMSGTERWAGQVTFLRKSTGDWSHQCACSACCHWGYYALPQRQASRGVCRSGSKCPCVGTDVSDGAYHQTRTQGNAGGASRVGLDGGRAPSVLERTV